MWVGRACSMDRGWLPLPAAVGAKAGKQARGLCDQEMGGILYRKAMQVDGGASLVKSVWEATDQWDRLARIVT